MSNRMQLQSVRINLLASLVLAVSVLLSSSLQAQEIPSQSQIKWKSEAQVRAMLGEPQATQGPIGTHATYVLWKYPEFTVAFSNQRAIHVFSKNSLRMAPQPKAQ